MLRTIEAPGIEIREVDKSTYPKSLTGSNVLVAGFANRGKDYVPMVMTSKNAWLNYYGQPVNEAERYFYRASMEVINQGGKLYASKLPYDNDAKDIYTYKRYTLASKYVEYPEDVTYADVSAYYDNRLKIDEAIVDLNAIKNDITKISSDISSMIEGDKKATNVKDKISNNLSSDWFAEIDMSLENFTSTYWKTNFNSAFDNVSTNIKYIYEYISNKDSSADFNGVYTSADYNSKINDISALVKSADSIIVKILNEENATAYSNYKVDLTDDQRNWLKWIPLYNADNSIDSVLSIMSDSSVATMTDDKLDEYSTGEATPEKNEFIIVDSLRSTYDSAIYKNDAGKTKEYLGIIPVVTTAANALYFQSLLDVQGDTVLDYQAVKTISSLCTKENSGYEILSSETALPFRSTDKYVETVSNKVARTFPAIQYVDADTLDRDNLKKIGIVVLKAYSDPSMANKINYDVLESYVGELDKDAKDPSTGATTFIQEIVNSQSQYIEVYAGDIDKNYKDADILVIDDQAAGSLGFYKDMVAKDISYNTISDGLNKIYEKNSDINEKDIDIVLDAGVSNIAQYIKTVFKEEKGEYVPDVKSKDSSKWTISSKENVKAWRTIITDKYNEFCKNVRKDCMFIADGLRPFCIDGSKKIVRMSKPSNTIEANIIPNLKYMSGINTSYGAGYCDWFEVMDEFSGKLFWCPPSIQACGVYINTDINANYWDAPAGLNRGLITALDVAFSPTIKQAGEIYQKCWNYAINYPDAGITLEGQKTFQVKPSAFDRVNVRRLFLRLERYVYKIARYYVYEGNTAFNRQRFVDQIVPYFETVKRSGGMYDYKIICDETINTPDVIDNNELRIKIGIKPTKTIEFILLQFVCLRTGGSFEEM